MPFYRHGARTTIGTISTTCWELRAGARKIKLYELKIKMAAATASSFGFGRPAAAGTATSPVVGQAHDPGSAAAVGATAVAFSSGPTAPTVYLERTDFPNVIGSADVMIFNPPLEIAASANVVLYNITATGVVDVTAVWEE